MLAARPIKRHVRLMDAMRVFDGRATRLHRNRAAGLLPRVRDVLDDVSARLLDRLDDTTHRFIHALDIGGRGGVAASLRARGMHVVSMDASAALARLDSGAAVCADPELLPFADGSFDLVVASASLHWVNDLPGALIQIRRALRPDGLFLASMPVLGTLDEFRRALTEAEVSMTGGASPRVSPFADLRDCAALLQRAGFALPVADMDEIEMLYADPFALLLDLRAAGETNAIYLRNKAIPPRELFALATAALPQINARARVILRLAFMTGWAPAAWQPQPLARGSAQVSLADALKPDD